MRHDPIYTAWLVRPASPAATGILRALLPSQIDPDYTMEHVVRAAPGGVESQVMERRRLGDYFAAVRVLPGPPQDPNAFRIVFHRLPGAGRCWKDVMAKVLQAIRNAAQGATIHLDYRGDVEPARKAEAPVARR